MQHQLVAADDIPKGRLYQTTLSRNSAVQQSKAKQSRATRPQQALTDGIYVHYILRVISCLPNLKLSDKRAVPISADLHMHHVQQHRDAQHHPQHVPNKPIADARLLQSNTNQHKET